MATSRFNQVRPTARRRRLLTKIGFLTTVAAALGGAAPAAAALPVPADLAPGQSYHLIFNSSSVANGLQANVNHYNQLVQQDADDAGVGASLGVAWKAVLSTPTVHARDNAPVGAATPVYNMNLQRVANNFADFWDGQLAAAINRDESNSTNLSFAWTGSLTTGFGDPGATVGNGGSEATAWAGGGNFANGQWIQFPTKPSLEASLHVYALSQTLTVPSTTGDFDGDGDVDGADALVWQRGLGATHDAGDLADWRSNFGFGGAQSAFAVVPEPGLGTLALGLATVLVRRSHHGRATARRLLRGRVNR